MRLTDCLLDREAISSKIRIFTKTFLVVVTGNTLEMQKVEFQCDCCLGRGKAKKKSLKQDIKSPFLNHLLFLFYKKRSQSKYPVLPVPP